jgi:RNA polymerase sigma-70 factor, ECF subfamily
LAWRAIVTNFPRPAVYFSQDPDDATLVARSLAGDTAAFEAIVVKYERVLFRVALRMLGNTEDARDATQTAFVSAYGKLASFDANFRFFSWLYRILLNECLNARRDRRPHEPVMPEMVLAASPLDALEASERRHRVQLALLALPHDYREVIVLRHFAEMGYDEIASTLGIAPKTVKSRLHTARQRLTELLILEKTGL